jgi:riboflavin kinase / FMN adenylyltransferase
MATFRVFRSLEEVPADFGPSALTIGNFDGVHAAHRSILRRLVAVARERALWPSALTFDPHPTKVVAPQRAPKLMSSLDERCTLMRREGIQQVLILPFDRAVAQLTPEEFVERVLVTKMGARAVLVGHDFRFGHKQAGNAHVLEELGRRYGFTTEVIGAMKLRGRLVSSTAVRQLIGEGQVAQAARLLERPYSLSGVVVAGHGVGSKQTVPTLNLSTEAEVLPRRGVYITRTRDLDGSRVWPSVTNIGYRPTFGGDSEISIETFLLDPLGGDTPRHIRVEFLWCLREERTFPDPAALKTQIMKDAGRALAYFRRLRRCTSSGVPPADSMS